jgi:hypothetical protein
MKSRRKKTTKIKFTIQFEKPDKAEVMNHVTCPLCLASVGSPCHTQVWGHPNQPGGGKMSDLHHDRYAEYMNLDIVNSGLLYEIKP